MLTHYVSVRIAMSSVTAAKKRRDRRLVIIRSYIRVKDGDSLKRVELRVLVDTGSQEEFISPRMAAKLGISIKTGLFGLAVTAFGDSCQLTRRAEDVELTIEGANPLSYSRVHSQPRSGILLRRSLVIAMI